MGKTVSSFVCLSILMLLSFIVSNSELNSVKSEYRKVVQNAENMKLSDFSNYMTINTWKAQVISSTHYGEPFLRFTLTAIISLGAILKLCY